MPIHLRIPVLDGAFRVAGLSEEGLAQLASSWARCAPERVDAETPMRAREVLHEVTDGGGETLDEQEMIVTLAVKAAIESRRGQRILLHGAALAEPSSGATVAIVGPSGAGKTTASLTLGRNFNYLTDETVSIDDELSVEPFPKPLSILEGTIRPKRQRSPDELGLLPARAPGHLEVVAIIERDADAESATASPLSLSEALDALVPQSSSLSALPGGGLVRLADALSRCRAVVRLRYPEAAMLSPVISELLGDASGRFAISRDEWTGSADLLAATEGDADDEWGASDSSTSDEPADAMRYRRIQPDDAIALADGSAALIIGERYCRVGPLAVFLWRVADDGVSLDALLAAAIRHFGGSPDAREHVTAALAGMDELGLVERV